MTLLLLGTTILLLGATLLFAASTGGHRNHAQRLRIYERLVDNSPDLIALVDPDYTYRLVNAAFLLAVEREYDQVVGHTAADVLGQEVFTKTVQPRLDRCLSGHAVRFEASFDFPGRGPRYMEVSYFPLWREEKVESVGVIMRDTTDRRRAEQALDTERRQLQALFDTLPLAVAVLDPNGRPLRINDQFDAIWHGSLPRKYELSDYAVLKGWWPESGEPLRFEQWPIIRALTKEETVTNEVIDIERFDGTHGTVVVSAAPIHDREGTLTGAVLVAQDITHQRELERMKSDFLNIASHELRTPLSPLRLLLQLSRRRVHKGECIDAATIDRMLRQTDRLTAMINDLLDVARLEKETIVLRATVLDLRTLIAESVEDFRRLHPERTIDRELPDTAVPVHVDPARIDQVTANFLDNALKYSPHDTAVEVHLTLVGDQARVAVTDHGPGIPRDQQEHLFTRFYRAATRTTRTKPGLGLGLFISRGIVELQGGSIGVESEIGRGSTFWYTVPLRTTRSSDHGIHGGKNR